MKKAYEKPALYAESFAMVEHVASGCGAVGGEHGVSVTYSSADSGCGIEVNGSSTVIFVEGGRDCHDWIDPFTGEQIINEKMFCYNTFDVGAMFSS